MATGSYYLKKLEQEFAQRQRKNVRFTLRAYARSLGIHAGTLSSVLKGKRPFPVAHAERVIRTLKLSPTERIQFLLSLHGIENSSFQNSQNQTLLNEEEHFHIISEWEHYAILSLSETKKFRPKPEWISEKLNITRERAQTAFNRLVDLGFLKKQGKKFVTASPLRTSEDVPSTALKIAHRDALEMGLSKLEAVPLQKRDYSTITMAVRPEKLMEAKRLIRQFRKDLAAILEGDGATEVYQLCIQLYPLTGGEHHDSND